MKLVDAPNIRHADLLAELEAHRGASGFVLEPGRDFLAKRKPRARHIVTNPPYGRGLADAFGSTPLSSPPRLAAGWRCW